MGTSPLLAQTLAVPSLCGCACICICVCRYFGQNEKKINRKKGNWTKIFCMGLFRCLQTSFILRKKEIVRKFGPTCSSWSCSGHPGWKDGRPYFSGGLNCLSAGLRLSQPQIWPALQALQSFQQNCFSDFGNVHFCPFYSIKIASPDPFEIEMFSVSVLPLFSSIHPEIDFFCLNSQNSQYPQQHNNM